jgi:ketosteroid isomerase-like protein
MTDKEAVELLGRRHVDAALAKDVDAFMATVTDDCALMPPHDPGARGKEAVRRWAEGFFGHFTIQNLEFPSTTLEVDRDWAFKHYTYDWTVVPDSGGTPIRDRGNGMYVYQRLPDGTWRVAYDLWTSNEPLAAVV